MLTRRSMLGGALALTASRRAHAKFPPHGKGSGSSPPPPPAGFVTDFTIKNYSGGTVTNPQISFLQPVATGDIPSGSHFEIRANDGVTVLSTFQQDQEPTWLQDGSWKAAQISAISPDTITAGASVTYQVFRQSGAPNRTPVATLAGIAAASDFKIQLTSGDFGSDVWQVSVNDIISNGSNWPWGSYPTRGWRAIRSGPACCEWKFTGLARRVSDSAWQKWVYIDIWVRAWGATGPFEIGARVRQSNMFGAHPSGTVGATPQPKYVFRATLLNGASVIYNWGGPGDYRVTPVPRPASTPAARASRCRARTSSSSISRRRSQGAAASR